MTPRLATTVGDFPLFEYAFEVSGRSWSVLHIGAILSRADESERLLDTFDRLPYGVALWPAAIALAHDVASREHEFAGRTVLELGAGAGLPGIVAATLGARVVQTDRNKLAMAVCRRNGERNRLTSIEHRLADWTAWAEPERYDWILGSDVLYTREMHPYLRRIFETNLAGGGRLLLSDPFRSESMPLLEALEASGWSVSMSKWSVGDDGDPSAIGVYELAPPG